MSSARERACRQPRSWMTLTSVNKNARLWKARDWNVCWFALSWGVHNAKCGMKGRNYGPESDALLAVLSVFTFCCICYVCWRTGKWTKISALKRVDRGLCQTNLQTWNSYFFLEGYEYSLLKEANGPVTDHKNGTHCIKLVTPCCISCNLVLIHRIIILSILLDLFFWSASYWSAVGCQIILFHMGCQQ